MYLCPLKKSDSVNSTLAFFHVWILSAQFSLWNISVLLTVGFLKGAAQV